MKAIESISFSLLSPEQIRKMSAVKVTVPDTYDEDGYPISGGLADQRLGVIDPGLKCRTCGNRMKDCPGHSGHIELVRPVVHAGFGKIIYHLLKATCRKCGRILSDKNTETKTAQTKACPHCGEEQIKVKFIKPTTYYEDKTKLLPNEIRERLERIPDSDAKRLGVKIRPENMVLTVLIVAPVTVRPSITLETGERSEDDLTHKLVDILRINQRLEENVDAGAPQLIIEDLWELLQYHITTYFDNETSGVPPARHRSGRQLKTLFQRLKGKEGRFRYNLSGKRVNFSARTVISPDPTMGINQLGVPEEMASELTLPVNVTSWNKEHVKDFIKAHPTKINYVIRTDGRRKKLTAANMEEVLAEIDAGYRIERQLADGDLVIFNRQPSLHRMSMMCHEVKVLPGKTLRFNICDCPPYNADFDGDEMNIHVPQNEEAQSEAEILMKVENQILSPRDGHPIISLQLDQVTGAYLLTQEDTIVSKEEAFDILDFAGVLPRDDLKNSVKGAELYSQFLPEGLNVTIEGKRGEVRIKNGRLASGVVDGRADHEITRQIFLQLGAKAARDYIDTASKATSRFMTLYGFSLSLDDYELSEAAEQEVREVYKEGRRELNILIKKLRARQLEQLPGKTMRETFEEKTMALLENVRYRTWKVVSEKLNYSQVSVSPGNAIKHNAAILMADSGGRGKPINVTQMCGLVGQQAVRGKRPSSGYKRRILPHFAPGNLGDQERGFVRHGFKQGLTPFEYFFHAAGGRDSVVDKGVNPAKTGYMQRRLVNALLDYVVREDNSVRDAEGNLIQLDYNQGQHTAGTGPIAAGEPVGVIAAQSIGEPGTQMTLRTFHYAGVASLAQLGFTRLVEIVDARKTPKKAVMEIHLKKAYNEWDKAKKVAASIEEITLEKVASINEDFDRKFVAIELNREALRNRGLTESEVTKHIEAIHPEYKKDGNMITIRSKKDSLRNIRKMTNQLKSTHLKGIPGIRRAILVEKRGSGDITIATDGSNMEEVFKLPEVDVENTVTNDTAEISRVLGIDAARNSIILEIHKVMEAQKIDVNPAHLALIADAMTCRGDIQSVGRHGLAGTKGSILARAAFEETEKHLVNACAREESDKLTGITENIIIGQTIPCGTGTVKLEMELD
ncbi:hypothetical protein COX86_00800 [Candidatus Micrarchaeota archaeon CG_4_10_14_0_2_um_filter_60_11]|nr:MAG: hypothetical protein COU39_03175 [Candidatus Micrarchaeota archaeon CG10_big_fil_rev_8_21_14_0_10_60_32]PIO01848.1 MAG: hypothetical protein COT58_03035 [Candidatus Micrarchaeota archaeon CG09_land_8_20_14_0_10_60_16]PIZ91212.1 MAG: hypothetical protein COX86_00800 [Candidatus Micrarchaeota archaeon CG_4_10_14_0_2_um_filter_60_11]